MKVVTTMDDSGDFISVPMSDRTNLWRVITQEAGGGDAWANREGEWEELESIEQFMALSEAKLIKLIRHIDMVGGRINIQDLHEDKPSTILREVSDSELPSTEELVKMIRTAPLVSPFVQQDPVHDLRRQWRKTALAFAMAYPEWFGPENGMIGSDIIENGLYTIDILPPHWVNCIISVNPNPNLVIEVQIQRDGEFVLLQVSRTGLYFILGKDLPTEVRGNTSNDREGMRHLDDAWNTRGSKLIGK